MLYRAACKAEDGDPQAKEILHNLVRPMAGVGLGAAAGVSLLGFGLLGAVAAAGLSWLLADREDNDEE